MTRDYDLALLEHQLEGVEETLERLAAHDLGFEVLNRPSRFRALVHILTGRSPKMVVVMPNRRSRIQGTRKPATVDACRDRLCAALVRGRATSAPGEIGKVRYDYQHGARPVLSQTRSILSFGLEICGGAR